MAPTNFNDATETAQWMVATCMQSPGLPPTIGPQSVRLTYAGRGSQQHRRVCFIVEVNGGSAFADCDIYRVGEAWVQALVGVRCHGQAWTFFCNAAETPPVISRAFDLGELVEVRQDYDDRRLVERLGTQRYRISGSSWVTSRVPVFPQMVTIIRADTGELVRGDDEQPEKFSGALFEAAAGEKLPPLVVEIPPLWRFACASEATPTGASTRHYEVP